MRTHRVSSFLLCLLAAQSAQALSVDELVAKNADARGGLDKIGAIKDLKFDGHLRVGGSFDLAYTQYKRAPDSFRDEATVQGLTQVQAWDGNEAWRISPFQGRKDPERLSSEDAKSLADDAAIGGQLVDYRGRGSKVEYLGTEDVDGTDAHKLKVTLKNGDIEYIYLDPDHFLEIRTVGQRKVRGTEVEDITDYGDYEQVAGVWFPFAITSRSKDGGNEAQITIDKGAANTALDAAMFAFPAAKSAK
jgi:hypothetical protein